MSGETVKPLHKDVVLVQEVAATAIQLKPTDEDAVLLDLAGKLNRVDAKVAHRYVLPAGAVAELMAKLVVAGRASTADFRRELDDAIQREQERLADE
jgi:hypothetical protein